MHKVLVNGLGGLSLPRKSVIRLTDRLDMTIAVYHGRKTTTQYRTDSKQCRPSSDAAKCGILSGSALFANRNFCGEYSKNENNHQKDLKLEMD